MSYFSTREYLSGRQMDWQWGFVRVSENLKKTFLNPLSKKYIYGYSLCNISESSLIPFLDFCRQTSLCPQTAQLSRKPMAPGESQSGLQEGVPSAGGWGRTHAFATQAGKISSLTWPLWLLRRADLAEWRNPPVPVWRARRTPRHQLEALGTAV